MRYLLDTDIVSDMVRNPKGPAAKHLARVGTQSICISIIVASELRYGAFRKGAAKLTRTIEEFLERVVIEPFDHPADRLYAEIRARMEEAGTPIGQNDTLIAAHSLALDCILVTNNMREFSRISDLKLENWLR
jgi:tRNA(fMet)-specific endonuclease VapC